METFSDIFKKINDLVKQNPNKDIKELVSEHKGELGINDELMKKIETAYFCTDKFDEKYKSLQDAKREGQSRSEWLSNDIQDTARKNGLSDEYTEELISSLDKQLNDNANKEEVLCQKQ